MTLEIHSLVEGEIRGLVKFCFSGGCVLLGYLTACYRAGFSPDRKDRCKSLRHVP